MIEERAIEVGTRLAIIRHGEAVCNAEGFVGGPLSCRGLTPLGVRQSEVLAERLLSTGELGDAAALWTSELRRAAETAAILAPALGALAIESSATLCERDPGEADGLTWLELAARYGRSSTPGDEPDLPLSPGGESWIGFVDRAAAALVDLAARYPGELVVVVAHGGVIDSSMIRFLGLPEHGAGVRLHADNTSITEWRHTGRRWRLVRYNDAAHLHSANGPLHALPPEWVFRER
jgi:2,3-bisphosphoglycerate-dependent phosphoglycerate mutase